MTAPGTHTGPETDRRHRKEVDGNQGLDQGSVLSQLIPFKIKRRRMSASERGQLTKDRLMGGPQVRLVRILSSAIAKSAIRPHAEDLGFRSQRCSIKYLPAGLKAIAVMEQ